MLTDAQVAQRCHDIYSGGAGFTKYFAEEGFSICCGVESHADENLIVFRGTVPAELANWIQDLLAYPKPFQHAVFGPIHAGSFCGMPEIMEQIAPGLNLSRPTTIAGHSLGGQRAVEAAALMLLRYQPDPDKLRVVSLAGPAAGFQQLLKYLSAVKMRVYRNAVGFFGDPVPLLPVPLAPLFAYQNVPLTHVTQEPGGFLDLSRVDPVAWHNSELYVEALKKLGV